MIRGTDIALLLLATLGIGRNTWAVTASETEPQTCTASDTNDGTCVGPPLATPASSSLHNNDDRCGMYIAESTIPHAGLGIFTALPKKRGDSVGTPDICIPVIDMHWHNGGEGSFFNPFADYFWTGSVMGMAGETDSEDIEALCPGLDCAVNCHIGLINTQKGTPVYDESGLHRSVDPGVGAFSPYHNGTSKVSRDIPAGAELFKFYGDNWFETRPDMFGLLPLSKDYPAAQNLLYKFVKACPKSVQPDVYDIIMSINSGKFQSRTLNALPKTYSDALLAVKHDLGYLLQPSATRPIEWLEENGRCIDHIVPGVSTIKQAARGAFAAHSLKKDQIITTSPLHHIPDRKYVNMYNMSEFIDENGQVRILRHIDQIVNKQVLLNYCFGHKDSTMLLFPYSSGINYINHNKTLANVKIRWAQNFTLAHKDEALEKKVEDFDHDYSPKLAFDYVALRDIKKGEELFMDYGDEWEEAWQEHVSTYTPTDPNAKLYGSGRFWNNMFREMLLRTHSEQIIDPYPDHLQIRCHHQLKSRRFPKRITWAIKDYGYPCRILDRFYEDGEYMYTVDVEMVGEFKSGENGKNPNVTWIQRTDVPRSGIAFFDKPFHTDLHLSNAFRQPIGIPSDMIPPHWLNDVKSDQDEDENVRGGAMNNGNVRIKQANATGEQTTTTTTSDKESIMMHGQMVPTPH